MPYNQLSVINFKHLSYISKKLKTLIYSILLDSLLEISNIQTFVSHFRAQIMYFLLFVNYIFCNFLSSFQQLSMINCEHLSYIRKIKKTIFYSILLDSFIRDFKSLEIFLKFPSLNNSFSLSVPQRNSRSSFAWL